MVGVHTIVYCCNSNMCLRAPSLGHYDDVGTHLNWLCPIWGCTTNEDLTAHLLSIPQTVRLTGFFPPLPA